MVNDILLKIIADWLVIPVALLAGAAMLFAIKPNQRYQAIARAVVAGLVALLLAKVASLLYQGQRPFIEMGAVPKAAYLPNPGFPSDHTLLVFTATFVVWAAVKNVAISSAMFVMSVLVALGRVLALVHTPIDVIGGFLCALLAVIIIYGRQLWSTKP